MSLSSSRLTLFEVLRSLWNSFWYRVRMGLRFQRPGYKEATVIHPRFSPESKRVNDKFEFTPVGKTLSPKHWHRNLATLWYLEKMLAGISFPESLSILEPGSQDFSRLPALRTYFKFHNVRPMITGIELDPFVPLGDFHSLWDHAQYYRSLEQDEAMFIAGNFFEYTNPVDLIICFYPFVSAAPALAWGLPAHYASAENWIDSFIRNVKPMGHVFVVHQGEWEESDFDHAREGKGLKLIKREELKCPFFSTKYPARGSLYLRP
jgi:hypothetical protein